MAAPVAPVAPGIGKGFWVSLYNAIVTASNLSVPIAIDASQTGVLSGATATLVIAAIQKQIDLT